MTEPVLPDGFLAVVPDPEGRDAPFWAATRRDELWLQRCDRCLHFQWLPEWICHHCLSRDLSYVEVAPKGTIYSWERVWHPASPELVDACPFVILVVEVDDAPGVRLVGNLIGPSSGQIPIGARVEAVFEHHDSYSLVQWRFAS
jgi:uncharacterized protein